MMVLGIETSTTVCGVAICRDGEIVAKSEKEGRNIHSESILSLVHEAIADSGINLGDIDGIAVSAGPGSFTGLRIGLSVAKGLVFATGKKLLAVPTLEALAYRVVMNKNTLIQTDVLAALDARRDEVYCQLFQVEEGRLSAEKGPRAMHVAEVVGEIGSKPVLLIGDGNRKLIQAASALGLEAMYTTVPDEINTCSSASVVLLGLQMLQRNDCADPVTAEPYYIKEFFEVR